MAKTICLALLLAFSMLAAAGCYQTGKVAGEAVKGVEQGVKDLQRGFEHGHDGKQGKDVKDSKDAKGARGG